MSIDYKLDEITSYGEARTMTVSDGPSASDVIQSLRYNQRNNALLLVRFTADIVADVSPPGAELERDKLYQDVRFYAIISGVMSLPGRNRFHIDFSFADRQREAPFSGTYDAHKRIGEFTSATLEED